MCMENRNFSNIFPEKSKFFVKLPEKIEICLENSKFCWPGFTTSPQISNQIDAADAAEYMPYIFAAN